MRLLRLTTDDENGVFNNNLQQEIELAPKSQIALGNLSLEVIDNELIIDNTNDVFTFSVVNGTLNTARFTHTNGQGNNPNSYDSSNFQLFFNDFMNQVNGQLGRLNATGEINVPADIGKQVLIKKGERGKIQIKFNKGNSKPYGAELDSNIPQAVLDGVLKNVMVIPNPTANNARILANSTTGRANDNYRCSTYQNHPIARGCGVHRARVSALNNVAGGLGASISLHSVSPQTYLDTRDIVIGDIAFGLRQNSTFGGGGGAQDGYYQFIINGVLTDPALADRIPIGITSNTATNNVNDVMALEIVNGNIRGVVYRNNAGNPATVSVIFSRPYNGTDALFASYTIHGAGQTAGVARGNIGCELAGIRFTPDPYLATTNEAISFPNFEPEGLGASTPSSNGSSRETRHSFRFSGTTINEFLGYATPQQPQIGDTRLGNIAIFEAQITFKAGVINDCFLLELLNLQIDSYDFHETERKRKNLIAVLPFDDSLGKCIFQPTTLNFLDLNNKFPLKINEIKMRILRADYSPVLLRGLSSAVLYVK